MKSNQITGLVRLFVDTHFLTTPTLPVRNLTYVTLEYFFNTNILLSQVYTYLTNKDLLRLTYINLFLCHMIFVCSELKIYKPHKY